MQDFKTWSIIHDKKAWYINAVKLEAQYTTRRRDTSMQDFKTWSTVHDKKAWAVNSGLSGVRHGNTWKSRDISVGL